MAASSKYVWKDMGWASIKKRVLAGPKAVYAQVGTLGTAGDEVHHERGTLTVSEVGLLQEFGNSHIPQRSFLRSTLVWSRKNRKEFKTRMKIASFKMIFLGRSKVSVVDEVGAWGADKVRDTIRAGKRPANKPETKRKKGHGLTLRDTLQLLAAIGHQVLRGGQAAGAVK